MLLRFLFRKSSLYLVLGSFSLTSLGLNAATLISDEERIAREKAELARLEKTESENYQLIGTAAGMFVYVLGLFAYNVHWRANTKDTSSDDFASDNKDEKSDDLKSPQPKRSYIVDCGLSSDGRILVSKNDFENTIQPNSRSIETQVFSSNKEEQKEPAKIELTEEEKIETARKELYALVSNVNAQRRRGSVNEWELAKENLQKKMEEIKKTILSSRSHLFADLKEMWRIAESCLRTQKN